MTTPSVVDGEDDILTMNPARPSGPATTRQEDELSEEDLIILSPRRPSTSVNRQHPEKAPSMTTPLVVVGEDDLLTMNAARPSGLATTRQEDELSEEDLIILSPRRPSTPVNRQQPEKEPSFIDEWLATIQRNRTNNLADREKIYASIRTRHDDTDGDDSGDAHDEPDATAKLLTPTAPPPSERTRLAEAAASQSRRTSSGEPRRASPGRADALGSRAPSASPRPLLAASPVLTLPSPGRTVTIHPLPGAITLRDVLARISTGAVRNAILVRPSPWGALPCAVVVFKEARAAVEFVHICRAFDGIWAFCEPLEEEEEEGGGGGGGGGGGERIQGQVHYSPSISAALTHRADHIPLEPRPFAQDEDATRCLKVDKCAFARVRHIWNALKLGRNLASAHYRNNVDDIWMDGFRSGGDGTVDGGSLHIWYTNVEMAVGARTAIERRFQVSYERDPCDGEPFAMFFRPSNDPGYSWHSIPRLSLLNVHHAGRVDHLFAWWDSIAENRYRAPRTACVDALVSLAASGLPSTVYSPGTATPSQY